MGTAAPASASNLTAVTVLVFGPDGAVFPGRTITYDDLTPLDGGEYTSYDDNGQPDPNPGPLLGLSVDRLLGGDPLHIAPANIDHADVTGVGLPCNLHLSSAFGDFGDPATATDYPFERALPPLAASRSSPGQELFTFAIPVRIPGHGDATVTDGKFCNVSAVGGASLVLAVHLRSSLLAPQIEEPASPVSMAKGTTVAFRAVVNESDSTNALTWTWDFADGGTAVTHTAAGAVGTRSSATSHQFNAPGTWLPKVTVTSSNQSASGVANSPEVVVSDPGASQTPTTDSPLPGESHGNGDTEAPEQGPATGSGARVGGVATGRPGSGRAGVTFDPRSASPTSSGTGDAPAEDDVVVGYLLSDGTGGAEPGARAGAKPLDDSAPAARNGVTSFRLGGWLLTAAVVIALLAAGAGSERRRPRRAGRRR